jgi:hypothetical protein
LEEKGIKVKMVFYDEFSCSTRPNTSYAWAVKNTRPKVKSNERSRVRLNGLLAIDTTTGKEYLKLTPKAKTEDVAQYFCDLVKDSIVKEPDLDVLIIYLDNNSTHKKKMKERLQEKLENLYKTQNIKKILIIQFKHTPPYSPDYNLAEYIIRLTRQILLHHLPVNTTLEQIQSRLDSFFQNSQLQTPVQIENTINHILKLGVGRE